MKQQTVKLLCLLSGIAVAVLSTGEVKAIPILDDFDSSEDHSVSTTFSGSALRGDQDDVLDNDTSGTSIIGNDPNTSTNGERDVDLVTLITNGGFANSSVDSLGDFSLVYGGFNSSSVVEPTLTLTYDGEDGTSTDPEADPTGSDFNSSSGLNNINVKFIDSNNNGTFDSNEEGNNVLLLKNVVVVNEPVDMTVELFSGSDSVSSSFTVAAGTNRNLVIAFREEVANEGVAVDGIFENGPNSFDFTKITAVRHTMEGQINGSGNASVAISDTEFEGIPFEAESSIAIALVGAWGGWKYWKRRKEGKIEQDISKTDSIE